MSNEMYYTEKAIEDYYLHPTESMKKERKECMLNSLCIEKIKNKRLINVRIYKRYIPSMFTDI